MYKILSVGEVLWDLFPDYKKPGGSPANVAYHLHCLGTESLLLSRVGKDERGGELLRFLNQKGIETKHIQHDNRHPTGVVHVQFQDGEPSYIIQEPSAWDFIRITEQLKETTGTLDAICFASLSQRNPVSESTIQNLLSNVPDSCMKVFDLNLRPPFINKELIIKSINQSDIIKINEHEFKTVSGWMGSKHFTDEIIKNSPTKTILVTEGAKGSSMFTSEGFFREKAHPIQGEGDFVGVGDAFLACFVYLKLKNTPNNEILALANQYAAFVASRKGGMPEVPSSVIHQLNK